MFVSKIILIVQAIQRQKSFTGVIRRELQIHQNVQELAGSGQVGIFAVIQDASITTQLTGTLEGRIVDAVGTSCMCYVRKAPLLSNHFIRYQPLSLYLAV